jgi:hypothetical protein
MALFQDLIGSSPLATASRMCEILGSLPPEWMEFPFEDDYPVHEAPQRGIEYTTLGDFTERNDFTLDTEVGLIRERQEPPTVSTNKTASGREWLCLPIPTFRDTTTRDEFGALHLKPIHRKGRHNALRRSSLQDLRLRSPEAHHNRTGSSAPMAKRNKPGTPSPVQCRTNRVIGSSLK